MKTISLRNVFMRLTRLVRVDFREFRCAAYNYIIREEGVVDQMGLAIGRHAGVESFSKHRKNGYVSMVRHSGFDYWDIYDLPTPAAQ